MKQFLLSTILFSFIFSCKGQDKSYSSFLPQNPKHQAIFDSSNIFSASENSELTKKIIQYKNETAREIVVVTVDSISPYIDIQKYANDLGNYWGVGEKELDNGLIIVFSKPIRELAIATGLGTEKVLTDSMCQQVIDNLMIPVFKKGKYFEGINSGIDELIKAWNATN